MKYYVWIYFMIFTILILTLLWVFQYFFLQNYYQSAKKRDMTLAAARLSASADSDDFYSAIKETAFKNAMNVKIVDEMGNELYNVNNMGSFSLLAQDKFGMKQFELIGKLEETDKATYSEIMSNSDFKVKEIVLITGLSEGDDGGKRYLIIEASIEPLDSTTKIIREQLFYISIILFELAFIVTIIISRRLSKPITELTETAKQFGAGDYEISFTASGYAEVEELSNVLEDAKDEIKKVSDLRKELIANVSHDLRTPLTMVKAYAEMIRDLSGDNPEKREEHLKVIIDESDRLSNLVNDLLAISRMESGNIELNKSEFSVVQKLADCMTRYTLLIEQEGYDIQYIPDEDRIVCADMEKIDQVIYNFINNAINYTGDEKVIRLVQKNKHGCVRIEVTDNGQGISKELLPKVFDRYYRGEKYKRDVVGTGLGLSICKEILKKHDFAFGVTSTEGVGSTFWFEMPTVNEKKHSKRLPKEKPERKVQEQKEQNTDQPKEK
ncbi:MAG: HAMP domain-containing histidine kinase [Ruminococcus sp.]|nr:HAMP domain-containing histidine kinase [Ruminococcus sp.]